MEKVHDQPPRTAGGGPFHGPIWICGMCLFIATILPAGFALEPEQLLLIANADVAESIELAEYYCKKRNVPPGRILSLPLGDSLADSIPRADYEEKIASPVREKLTGEKLTEKIRCLLIIYGVPIKIGSRGRLPGAEESLDKLQSLLESRTKRLAGILAQLKLLGRAKLSPSSPQAQMSLRTLFERLDSENEGALSRIGSLDGSMAVSSMRKWLEYQEELYGKQRALEERARHKFLAASLSPQKKALTLMKIKKAQKLVGRASSENWPVGRRLAEGFYGALEDDRGLRGVVSNIHSEMEYIKGSETGASVDSELSLVLNGEYPLYRWRVNELRSPTGRRYSRTLMVCRLDGPGAGIARGLVDKALTAEKTRPYGIAYIDSRGIADDNTPYSFGSYDQSLRELAAFIEANTEMPVVHDRVESLFSPGDCPLALFYCGWYSLKKYIDAFDFVDGAVGFHISSWEAIDLRDPNSSQWCPAMLRDGITATLGAVAEPYLAAFPSPLRFFGELISGRCLVEAFYYTKPFNSWQLVLIGDPLYRPAFGRQGD